MTYFDLEIGRGAEDEFHSSGLRGHPGTKCILVTGGAGFLGSHLCARLIGEGHRVVAIDNFHTGRLANIAWLLPSRRLMILQHDVTSPIPSGMPPFDEIYNLACPASPVHYQEDPIATLRICSLGVMNVLERAAADKARIFHTSTSEIYGDPEIHPQQEGYWGNVNPIGPRSCYDEGKRFAETLITDYARQTGITAKIVRIFNTYGPRMQPNDGRVVSNFIIQALQDADITMYGDGSQTRSFCFVDDMIEGFVRLMRSDASVDAPVNIGNPQEVSVRELAERIVAMTGSRSRLVHRPLPTDDPRRRRPDISRASTLLGWAPTVPLEIGLTATIAHFADRLEQERLGQDRPGQAAPAAVAPADHAFS